VNQLSCPDATDFFNRIRLIPAVRVVDVRFPAVLGGFILSSRHGGQLAGRRYLSGYRSGIATGGLVALGPALW
jgi:hypothetical protein